MPIRRRDILGRLALAIASLLFSLLLFETALHLLKLPDASSDPNFAEMVRRIDAQEFFYEVDPELFWRLSPNLDVQGEATFIRTNAFGFRGDDVSDAREAGSVRLLLLGDSVTFGYGVAERATFASILEAKLRSRFPSRDIDVVNGGTPGYTSLQGLNLLRRVGDRLSPDLIVASFGFNDARDMFASDRDVLEAGRSLIEVRRFLYKSRLYRLLRSLLVTPPPIGPTSAPVARVDPRLYRSNLEEMARWARRSNAVLVLLESPFQMPTLRPYGPTWFTLHDSVSTYRHAMRDVAHRLSLTCVSVPLLTETQNSLNAPYFLDPAHPNERGHRVIADSLAAALTPELDRILAGSEGHKHVQ